MDLQIFNEKLDKKARIVFERILAFIDCNYNMEILYDGADEVKLRRSGKTLVTMYAKQNKLTVLIIFGKKEREKYEEKTSEFSEYINSYYEKSKTYHDGKWMFIDLYNETHLPEIIKMIEIKKKSNPTALTMCGYKCDLCKAYSKNIKKNDKRKMLYQVWNKYYDLDIKQEDIYCDGCRCKKRDAKRIDDNCPVRACVIDKKLHSCMDCNEYPCDKFLAREGLSCDAARQKFGKNFCQKEFNEYLLAYDNKTRIDKYKKILRN